jgi:hypothetical protein
LDLFFAFCGVMALAVALAVALAAALAVAYICWVGLGRALAAPTNPTKGPGLAIML